MYPKFFDLLDGEPRKAMRLAFDLAKVNNGDFVEKCDSAVRNGSHREAREAIRYALSVAGYPSAEAQGIAGKAAFSEIVNL